MTTFARMMLVAIAGFLACMSAQAGAPRQTAGQIYTNIQNDRQNIKQDRRDIRQDRNAIIKARQDMTVNPQNSARDQLNIQSSKQDLKGDRKDLRKDKTDLSQDWRSQWAQPTTASKP